MSHRTELDVELTGGLLQAWQRRNREATIPHAIRELRAAGNLDNLRRLADPGVGPYRGRYPFLDTDLYKTLEGLAYEAGRDEGVREFYDEVVELLQEAQADDGYLNSYFQDPDQPKQPWSDLAWGHELYNLGHLVQAAVAAHRQLNDDRLLIVARRFADLVVGKFGPQGEPGIDGHPEVEMALVELYRETGELAYLTQAELFVERRGRGNLVRTIFPGEYFQDHVPFRELPSVIGHAVRMAYLAAGAADVHLETGDPTLLAALERLWDDMVATKLYLTGGLGSRHSDEAIGDRYELPSERAYAETCAAIALMQWAWRMFLATGKASYLDAYETVLYNAYAVGLSADGMAFFYDNPLQRRPDHEQRSGAESGGEPLRRAWFGCPCCPPNIIRWMSELQDHLATAGQNTLTIGLYADARISTGEFTVTVSTDYPWDGEIVVTVVEAPAAEQTLVLRIPAWTQDARLDGEPVTPGWATVRRSFKPGDSINLSLPMAPRAHGSHPYLDATRGAIAVARGPLVYCVEQQDSETPVDDLLLSATAVQAATARRQDDHVVLDLTAAAAPAPPRELYPVLTGRAEEPVGTPVPVTFVPYFLWGNREALAMRVWLRSEGEGR
ncbi:glycoside hydrolase family 127 protein [Kribbella albertanoniae]|uniref:Glycoside hydrolase family 127 protein n=1 Tax=Kribbella albertanoniae TaxID=1266829 RepID=A0A4R4PHW7_9ACTN|nr:beta-L-arabinofuranosidase domain-containing protein [Kribbella albertanoniae]TDC21557.1 glycoside hydrolase family 127 protein [Kribbella albertanoniae]